MNRIKELRTKKGIRQSDLAKYLNIAQNTLSYWEKGKYDIDIVKKTVHKNSCEIIVN